MLESDYLKTGFNIATAWAKTHQDDRKSKFKIGQSVVYVYKETKPAEFFKMLDGQIFTVIGANRNEYALKDFPYLLHEKELKNA